MRSTWTHSCCDLWFWDILLESDTSKVIIRTSNWNDWLFLWRNSVYFSSIGVTSEDFFMGPVQECSYLWDIRGCSVLQFEHSLSNTFSRVLNSLKRTVKKIAQKLNSNPRIFTLLILHQCKWKCLLKLSWLMYPIIFKMVCDFWYCGTSVLLWVGRWKKNLITLTEF